MAIWKKGPDKGGKAAEGDKRLRKQGIKTNPHIFKSLETHPSTPHQRKSLFCNIAIYMDSIALRHVIYIKWKFVFCAVIRATSEHVGCNRLASAHISSIVHKSPSLFPSGLDGVKLTGQPCLHRGVKAEEIASGVMAPVGTRCRCEQLISSLWPSCCNAVLWNEFSPACWMIHVVICVPRYQSNSIVENTNSKSTWEASEGSLWVHNSFLITTNKSCNYSEQKHVACQ